MVNPYPKGTKKKVSKRLPDEITLTIAKTIQRPKGDRKPLLRGKDFLPESVKEFVPVPWRPSYKINALGRILNPNGKEIAVWDPQAPKYRRVKLGSDIDTELGHRIVWKVFVGPIPKGLEINHVDGVHGRDRLSNLELGTSSYNKRHSFDNLDRIILRGEDAPTSKISRATAERVIRLINGGYDNSYIQEKLSLTRGIVHSIRTGRWWSSCEAKLESTKRSSSVKKVSVEDRMKVLKLISSGRSNETIAEKFGVTPTLINYARNRKIWPNECKRFDSQ
jgi:hypothetical protein